MTVCLSPALPRRYLWVWGSAFPCLDYFSSDPPGARHILGKLSTAEVQLQPSFLFLFVVFRRLSAFVSKQAFAYNPPASVSPEAVITDLYP